MSKITQIQKDAFGVIDAAISILEKFPDLTSDNGDLSMGTSANPFNFLWELLKNTAGYNVAIDIISKFITYMLPPVEIAVKGILLTQLKNILSCSVNPLITKEVIKDGVVFTPYEIDLMNTLRYYPFDEQIGKYYYFGCDDMQYIDELPYSEDMNALIWFMINKADKRYIWKDKKGIQATKANDLQSKLDYNIAFKKTWNDTKNDLNEKKTYYEQQKQTLNEYIEDNIGTLDGYFKELNDLKKSYNDGLIPTGEYKDELSKLNNQINELKTQISQRQSLMDSCDANIDKIDKQIESGDKRYNNIDKNNKKINKEIDKLTQYTKVENYDDVEQDPDKGIVTEEEYNDLKEKIPYSEYSELEQRFRKYYTYVSPQEEKERKKNRKSDGIITFEYTEDGGNAKNSIGEAFYTQRPLTSCMHVFPGNTCQIVNNDITEKEAELYTCEHEITDLKNEIYSENIKLDVAIEERDSIKREDYQTDEEYKTKYYETQEKVNAISVHIEELRTQISNKYVDKNRIKKELIDLYNDKENYNYPQPEDNYYYNRTIVEFNFDYVRSLKLFDAKSVISRLLDQLIGLLTINLDFSVQEIYVRNEVKKMIQMIVENDDVTVSDCFFTFSNDTFDALQRDAELKKAGLLSSDGSQLSAIKVDTEKILSSLNEINSEASKENIQTTISGALNTISGEITGIEENDNIDINFSARINFIERLLTELSYVITSAVLSPKVYLLILIDLKLIGRETTFNLEQFIGQYKQLIVQIVTGIKDEILRYLTTELMKFINELASQISLMMVKEQADYYRRLINKLIECFKRNKGDGFDFNIDNVNYADIYESTEEPVDSEC